MAQGPFRDHYGGQRFYRVIKDIVNQDIAVLAVIFDLAPGLRQPACNLGLVQLALSKTAVAQTFLQNFRSGWKNKNADRIRHSLPHLGSTLNIDVEQKVVACRLGVGKRLAGSTVVVAKYLGPLTGEAIRAAGRGLVGRPARVGQALRVREKKLEPFRQGRGRGLRAHPAVLAMVDQLGQVSTAQHD